MTLIDQNSTLPDIWPENVLVGEPKDIAQKLAPYRPADAADALNTLDREVAARVLEAMRVSAAIQVLNEPNLDEPAKLVELMPVDCAPAILIGLHPDRRADIFRDLPEPSRASLRQRLPVPMRDTLDQLLRYPPHSAGGLM